MVKVNNIFEYIDNKIIYNDIKNIIQKTFTNHMNDSLYIPGNYNIFLKNLENQIEICLTNYFKNKTTYSIKVKALPIFDYIMNYNTGAELIILKNNNFLLEFNIPIEWLDAENAFIGSSYKKWSSVLSASIIHEVIHIEQIIRGFPTRASDENSFYSRKSRPPLKKSLVKTMIDNSLDDEHYLSDRMEIDAHAAAAAHELAEYAGSANNAILLFKQKYKHKLKEILSSETISPSLSKYVYNIRRNKGFENVWNLFLKKMISYLIQNAKYEKSITESVEDDVSVPAAAEYMYSRLYKLYNSGDYQKRLYNFFGVNETFVCFRPSFVGSKYYNLIVCFPEVKENKQSKKRGIFYKHTSIDDQITYIIAINFPVRIGVQSVDAKSIFLHEFVHYLDKLRQKTKKFISSYDSSKIEDETKKQTTKDFVDYYNDVHEYNAFYHQFAEPLLSFLQQLRKDDRHAKIFIEEIGEYYYGKNFDDFYNKTITQNIGLRRFVDHLTPETRKRFLKRLSKTYTEVMKTKEKYLSK